MTDIVKKLRLTYRTGGHDETTSYRVHLNPDGEEAAKEIEDLRRRNEILREVIHDMELQITSLNILVEKLEKPPRHRRLG